MTLEAFTETSERPNGTVSVQVTRPHDEVGARPSATALARAEHKRAEPPGGQFGRHCYLLSFLYLSS